MKKDIILIIDTTREELFLSLIIKGKRDDVLVSDCHSKHSTIMLEKMDELLKKHELELKDVDCFALSVGPGSFTGIRIGVATVKAFVCALGKEVVSINSLEADAYNHLSDSKRILSIIDAKHENAYYGLFEVEKGELVEKKLGFTNLEKIEKLKTDDTLFVSPYENSFGALVTKNYYDGFVNLVMKKVEKEEFSTEKFQPLYLKLSQAEEEIDGVSSLDD